MDRCDAVVVGAGPNGLVAAIALADAGWDVVVVEAEAEVGGAVRSAEVLGPGVVSDLFSAFYPLAAASPVIRDLDLESHGLAWRRSPDVLAHALPDGGCAVLHADVDDTAARLDDEAPGDGEAWRRMVARWDRIRDPLLDCLFTPLPPVRPGLRLLRRLGTADALDLLRLAALPVRRLAAEEFRGRQAGLLLMGNAGHADVPPDAAGSGLYGWLLSMLGQDVGFPVPEGGAGRLSAAMHDRFVAAGGRVLLGNRGGAGGGLRWPGHRRRPRRRHPARCPAGGGGGRVRPGPLRVAAARPRGAPAAARPAAPLRVGPLDHQGELGAVPARAVAGGDVARAATVHTGVDEEGMVASSAAVTLRRAPNPPFVVLGQMAVADPTRAPAGGESVWAYTHLPQALARDRQVVAAQTEAVEQAVERVAPGFRDAVTGRLVQGPQDLEAADANLRLGAINGGSSSLHHQLVLRPVPGLGRPETPVEGLFLASASAHPGGGVHGACGWNAARSALAADGRTAVVRRALTRTAFRRVLGPA